MGQEITTDEFSPEHYESFRQHLTAEMELLRSWFEGKKFGEDALQCGLELEAWLIGKDGRPVPDNSLFLSTLDRKSVVPELSKFNFELNVSPQYLAGDGLRDMRCELSSTWSRCEKVANRLDHRIMSIGILPTVTNSMLCLENMSPLQRYAALNKQVLKMRGGSPLRLEIEGLDILKTAHQDLMLESAATSSQIHLKVPLSQSVRYYNASVITSAFTVALAANAPMLFGRRLWDDTRITVFEQAVDTAGPRPRVSFGRRFIENSLLELFEHNLEYHRVLLPAELEEAPALMPYVRMHNGTIWNWNRPLIGFEPGGQPHLRIEHRPMSATPTMLDLFADMSFYIGLATYLSRQPKPPEKEIPFEVVRDNFYTAARHGLDAQVTWLDGEKYEIADLMRDKLVDLALDALIDIGVRSDYVEESRTILMGRLKSKQNGAAWQRRKFADYDGDLTRLLFEYEKNQIQGIPIHTWE